MGFLFGRPFFSLIPPYTKPNRYWQQSTQRVTPRLRNQHSTGRQQTENITQFLLLLTYGRIRIGICYYFISYMGMELLWRVGAFGENFLSNSGGFGTLDRAKKMRVHTRTYKMFIPAHFQKWNLVCLRGLCATVTRTGLLSIVDNTLKSVYCKKNLGSSWKFLHSRGFCQTISYKKWL